VQNLVDNATKWNPPSLPIEISSTPGEIRVRDHGPGVPDAERELVFERFYRSATARTTPGSGLGLAIVRQIVSGHAGTVHVEAADGGGACFVIRLPVPAAGSGAGPAEEGGTPSPPR
jgi:two-component system sensor histidine kinase MprB